MTGKIISTPIGYDAVEQALEHHIAQLSSPVDSYYEMHLLKSEFFELSIEGTIAGLAGVYDKQLMTLFIVNQSHGRFSQQLFQEAKRLREVTSAYVPTSDELYLSHALEVSKTISQQAYFFKRGATQQAPLADADFELVLAADSDFETIAADTADFFDALKLQIDNKEIWIGKMTGIVVSYGIIEKSRIQKNTASIGMIVCENERKKGYGTKTLKALQSYCLSQGIEPIAGCWYYNHQSKKTIEASGLISQTRLLKISF